MKHHRVVIGRVDAIDQAIGGCFRTANLSLQQGIEGPLYVTRGQRSSIMKFHALMQVENVSAWIRDFPALGQSGLDV